MTKLGQLAKYVRSKNAGPFWVTIDIFCETEETFRRLKNSINLNRRLISNIYHVVEESVKIFYIEKLHVIKISFPRSVPQGHKFEKDMHSGQQYVQLLDVIV
ncbi:DUF4387 domain-containing protein [Pueribacillus theae]|uniref:DUF4387 domain-containing protein n=1 Tax=Pueribacillus theae TaxID=2171751 RepID=A0A2U1JSD0_9BACI|nr:DUF4387 domain-containing protein [Pueribacillus theae]PWA08022.1 DUF4387 domain-containing protein [Pueribacillus theae]